MNRILWLVLDFNVNGKQNDFLWTVLKQKHSLCACEIKDGGTYIHW